MSLLPVLSKIISFHSSFPAKLLAVYLISRYFRTRLIVYNCSNITGLEQIVHRCSKVVVEVPDGCMIVFTNHTIHTGVKSYEKQGGIYSLHLRMFIYIAEQDCFREQMIF